jgi:drug/metabolite transporter (DMT)-like permease
MFEPTTLATLLILASAAIHAVWNAMVKRAPDKMAIMVFISGWGSLLFLPLIPFAPLPDGRLVAYIAVSVCIHLIYQLSLTRALTIGELTFVYPVARGMGPLLVALFSLVFMAGDLLPIEFGAVLILVSGIFLTIGHKAGNRAGLAPALLTGTMIAAYTLVDGFAVKGTADPLTFVIWSAIGFGPVIMTYTALRHGRAFLIGSLATWPRGLPASVLSQGGYGLALYAYSLGSIGEVAALRETSIVFASLIGAFWLKEQMSRRKIFAIVLIAVGAVALKLV